MTDHRFIECKQTDIESKNRWFRQCQSNSVPFVVVAIRTKYARVEWDCISMPHVCDDAIKSGSNCIIDRLESVLRKLLNRNWVYRGSAYSAIVDKLAPSDARAVAAAIYEILLDEVATSAADKRG